MKKVETIKREFNYIQTVEEITNFHVWGISEGEMCLMVNIRTNGEINDEVFRKAKLICQNYSFSHTCIEVQTNISA